MTKYSWPQKGRNAIIKKKKKKKRTLQKKVFKHLKKESEFGLGDGSTQLLQLISFLQRTDWVRQCQER